MKIVVRTLSWFCTLGLIAMLLVIAYGVMWTVASDGQFIYIMEAK